MIKTFNTIKNVLWNCETNGNKMVNLNMLRGLMLELKIRVEYVERLLESRQKRTTIETRQLAPDEDDAPQEDPEEIHSVLKRFSLINPKMILQAISKAKGE